MPARRDLLLPQPNPPFSASLTSYRLRFSRACMDCRLLHQSGLLPTFLAEGRTHVVFFQDTNVLAFKVSFPCPAQS
eukprot:4363728-Pleurochrysis_carterae.AAC.4